MAYLGIVFYRPENAIYHKPISRTELFDWFDKKMVPIYVVNTMVDGAIIQQQFAVKVFRKMIRQRRLVHVDDATSAEMLLLGL
jgi:hypothetical protein